MTQLEDLTARITRRDPARSEATLQADIRSFILAAGLNLTDDQVEDDPHYVPMESQLGDGTKRRIDIEAGTCVIEVKKDLTVGRVLTDAVGQLGGYLRIRCHQTGARYTGVLTDGKHWQLFVPDPADENDVLSTGDPLVISSATDTERLRYWLATVLSTQEAVRPSRENIVARLGAESPAHAADHTTLAAIYEAHRSDPNLELKRGLWAKLLRTSFGEAFTDADHLFIDHTLLVLSAEAIAHAVLGLDISRTSSLTPRHMADGTEFANAGVYGVVEADFFDWPLDVPGGEEFVRSLANRIGRFDWSHVEHDVLKHLYEATITAETRRDLGEYYTPDWLADRMVAEKYSDPLNTSAMDVSCGSGTFLFHAARAYLSAADQAQVPLKEALAGLTTHVAGIDIHPVAVTLARVTYLLAIGGDRLNSPRGILRIPVFLGDSLQWEQRRDLLVDEDTVTISTSDDSIVGGGGGGLLFDDDLVFPTEVFVDADDFDGLVDQMASAILTVEGPARRGAAGTRFASDSQLRDRLYPILNRCNVAAEHWPRLEKTFGTWYRLHHTGRNHVWGYYMRNLIRPLWFSRPENRVDLLIGNPPWLRYAAMGQAMQERYQALCRAYGLVSGRHGVAGRDLSTLFVTRAVDLYLKPQGGFAYVMPYGTLSRKPHHAFRTGKWDKKQDSSGLTAAFDEVWNLDGCATGFPMTSAVIFGQKTIHHSNPLPSVVTNWVTGFSDSSSKWADISGLVTRSSSSVVQHDPADPAPRSPYKKSFRQGAIVLPRRLVCVLRESAGPLGLPQGVSKFRSRTSPQDKDPWVEADIRAIVADRYVRPLLLGEDALPYRLTAPAECIVPIDDNGILTDDQIAGRPELNAWWSQAEAFWTKNRKPKEDASLAERLDFFDQLSAQLPLDKTLRVIYTKSGNTLAAAVVRDRAAVVDHSLYWATVANEAEASYLTAILNSATLLERVKPLQTSGLFGRRHFDKYVFHIPFPRYDGQIDLHRRIADLGLRAETIAGGVDIATAKTFQQARKLIRTELAGDGIAQEIEDAVNVLLPVLIPEEFEE
jgi:N-6 DNA Methylase